MMTYKPANSQHILLLCVRDCRIKVECVCGSKCSTNVHKKKYNGMKRVASKRTNQQQKNEMKKIRMLLNENEFSL